MSSLLRVIAVVGTFGSVRLIEHLLPAQVSFKGPEWFGCVLSLIGLVAAVWIGREVVKWAMIEFKK